jgi:hypothetical protein
MPTETVMEAAKANGVSEASLRRARTALKIVASKDEYQGIWMLRLP